MRGDPILFFDKSLLLLVRCILSRNKKLLSVRSFNFIAISTHVRSNFSTNAVFMTYNYCSARLILPEGTILPTYLPRPVCDEINKSALSRVLHVTYFIPCSKKADLTLHKLSPPQTPVSKHQ